MSEFKLSSPPADCISSVEFHPSNPDLLLATSWDKTVRLYNTSGTNQNDEVDRHERHSGAVLAGCFSPSGEQVFSGGLDKKLIQWELGTNAYELGMHDMAISSLAYSFEYGLVASGSWDRTVRLWDSHAASALVEVLRVPERVYSIAISGNTMVAALAGRQFSIFDMRNRSAPVSLEHLAGNVEKEGEDGNILEKYSGVVRRSMLKYPTRRVALMPARNGAGSGMENGGGGDSGGGGGSPGFIYSSIEGRVAVEYFNAPANNYAFKCHRRKAPVESTTSASSNETVDLVYPVNALAFHPKFATFVTGGSDGFVNLWDGDNKKRLKQYGPYPTGISAVSFNSQGNKLAIASSYTFDQGDKQDTEDIIFIRQISDSEARPKLKSNSSSKPKQKP